MRYHTEVGRRVPLHAGSGRLLLASAAPEVQRELAGECWLNAIAART